MADFVQLVNGLGDKDPKTYFEGFFTRSVFKDYQIDESAEKDARQAIKTMFTSSKDLFDRVDLAFDRDPLCLEAFFVYFMLSEDIFVQQRFEAYYEHLSDYGDLSSYQKHCFLIILAFYCDFLMDLHNFTRAIKVQRQIIRLSGELSKGDVNRLSFMYSVIEEADDFYRLYLDSEFDAYDYILLTVTLLKHEDTLRAREVLLDMMEHIEYASYLDHMWDLDEKDEKQKQFIDTVDELYDTICSVPDFFSFAGMVQEETL